MKLNKKQILEYQKNRDPYLMVDEVENVEPGIYSKGYKQLKKDEWFFKVHWPGDPNMPGMLQLEALTQMASFSILTMPNNKNRIMYLTNADKIKFFRKVLPGDKLILETKVLSYRRNIATFDGKASVNEKIVCKAKFNLYLPEKLEKLDKI